VKCRARLLILCLRLISLVHAYLRFAVQGAYDNPFTRYNQHLTPLSKSVLKNSRCQGEAFLIHFPTIGNHLALEIIRFLGAGSLSILVCGQAMSVSQPHHFDKIGSKMPLTATRGPAIQKPPHRNSLSPWLQFFAYISVMGGTYESFFLPETVVQSKGEGYMVDLAAAIKEVAAVPVIAAVRI
jgi:hypothetical protein